jgi:hypothetical protein
MARDSSNRSHFITATWLLHLAAFFAAVSGGILYPFGVNNGDNVLGLTDDGSSGPVQLTIAFPFYNSSYTKLYVSIYIRLLKFFYQRLAKIFQKRRVIVN